MSILAVDATLHRFHGSDNRCVPTLLARDVGAVDKTESKQLIPRYPIPFGDDSAPLGCSLFARSLYPTFRSTEQNLSYDLGSFDSNWTIQRAFCSSVLGWTLSMIEAFS